MKELSLHPNTDWEKISANLLASKEERSKPGHYYTRWIDDTVHWQLVDRILTSNDWSVPPGVAYSRNGKIGDTYVDSCAIADIILQVGEEELSAEDYEQLCWVDYATELTDAIENYMNWKYPDVEEFSTVHIVLR